MWQELWCRAGRDSESRTLAIELYRAHQSWIKETLEDGIASGEFRSCDTEAHSLLISALCDGYGVQLMFQNPAMTVETASEAIWAHASAPLGANATFPKENLA